MSDLIYEAPPRSGENIEDLADAVRAALRLSAVPYFPIVPFAEQALRLFVPGIEFDVVEADLLGPRLGAVNPITRAFMLREDVYQAAVEGQGRHRFTVAHEAGHALMHIGTLNRMPSTGRKPPAYRDPEWQANRFAAALLMPRALVCQRHSVQQITTDFGVSRECAELRVKALKLRVSM